MNTDVKLTSFDNGIRLLYSYDNSPVVYCGFAINAGTRDEGVNEYGIAHLIEHLLFKGTNKRNSLQIIKRLEEVGGELNAYTTKEETFIYSVVPQKYAERAIELLSDIVFNSVFPENQIKKEREVIFEEIEMYNDTPSELIFDELEDLMFANSSLGHNILGTKKSLSKINSSDCIAFVKRCYTTDNMLFFLQGNIDENKFLKLTEKYICHTATRREFSRNSPNPYLPQNVVCNKNTNQTHCLIGNLTLSLSDDNTHSLTLLNNILGGTSLTSKLNLAIRERNGWVYSIDSSLNLYSDIGIWSIYFGCSESNYKKCIGLIHSELGKLTDKAIPAKQLEKYKQQLYGQMLINFQNKENYILSSAKIALHLNKAVSMEQTFERMQQICPEDIQILASQLFDNKRFTTLKYQKYSM